MVFYSYTKSQADLIITQSSLLLHDDVLEAISKTNIKQKLFNVVTTHKFNLNQDSYLISKLHSISLE